MASKELSIKVKVNLPTAGEIENQIQRSLRGLKDIKVDANVKLKVGKLGNLKRQLRNALGKENFRVNANVKVHGMSELNRISSKLKEIRRLANEPIKLNVDMGGHDFDKSIEEARRKANKELENVSPKQNHSQMMVEAQKEMRAQQRAIEKATRDAWLAEGKEAKAQSEELKNLYREQQNRAAEARRIAETEYNKAARRAGYDDSDGFISRQINKAKTQPEAEFSARKSKIEARLRSETEAFRKYKSALSDVTKAQVTLAKGGLGDNVFAEVQRQAGAAEKKVRSLESAIRKTKYASQASDLRKASDARIRMARAQAADRENVKVRRSRKSSAGMMNTLNTWDVLQNGVYGAAAVVNGLNEVDKAITKVTKVVPDSQAAVNRWKKNIYKDASEVGKTAPEFAAAVEQWATAGYNLKQSNRLAKASVMGSFVGEVPVEDMVKYMSVPMKAFQREGLKSKDIINSMNQVSNKHAIEMDDLGMAYQRASSTVAGTGTTFAQLTGIITAAQEGTREGGDKIGNAYKTIAANINQIGSGITKQAQNKNAFFESLGVQLKDSKGNLKSTYQVMDQLSKKWKHMSAQDKNTAALYAAGKNHQNIFRATLDNWDIAKQASKEAQQQVDLKDKNHGSAYQEFEKQKQSIEFQLASLKNTWMSFLNNISGGREGISQILQSLNGIGSVADKLASNKLFSQAVRWGVITAGIVMARNAITGMVKSFASIGNAGKGIEGLKSKFTNVGSSVSELRAKIRELRAELDGLNAKGFKSKTKLDRDAKGRTKGEYTGKDVGLIKYSIPENNVLQTRRGARKQYGLSKKYPTHFAPKELAKENDNLAQSYSNLTPAISRTEQKMRDSTKSITKGGKATAKLGKIMGVAGSVMGVIGSGLGVVGLGIDAITIASGALEMMGVHPWELIRKAIKPAQANAEAFSKSMQKIHSDIGNVNSGLKDNVLFNGTAEKSKKSLSGLDKVLKGVTDGSNQLSKGDWKNFKDSFNAISKANGLGIRAYSNNVEVLKGQMTDLKNAIHDVNLEQLKSGSRELDKLDKTGKKINSQKTLNDLLKTNNDYLKKAKELEQERDNANIGVASKAQGEKNEKNYQRKLASLRGSAIRKEMGSAAYQEWAQQYQDYGDSVRKQYGELASILNSGIFKKTDFNMMSSNDLRKMGTAQTMNLQNAARANKIWNDVNKQLTQNNKLGSQQGKLTKEQQQYLSKNVKGLEGISRNMSKWTDAQRTAFDEYGKTAAKNLKNQQSRMMDILTAQGMSKSAAQKQVNKLDGTGLGYINALGNNYNAQALLNVDPDYAALYGTKWYPQLQHQQRQIQNYQGRKGNRNNETIDAFLDPQTGVMNTGMIARSQAVMTYDSKTKRKFQKMNFIDGNGNIKFAQVADAFSGVKGRDNPQELISELADGSINKFSKLHISANQSHGKLSKDVKSDIRNLVNKKGARAAEEYIKNLQNSGALGKDAMDYYDSLDRKGNETKRTPKSQRSQRKPSGSRKSSGSSKKNWYDKDDDDPMAKPLWKRNDTKPSSSRHRGTSKPDTKNQPRTSKNQQKALEKTAQGKQQTKSPNLIPNLLKKLGFITDAKADRKPKTAKDVEKNLKGRKVSDKELKNAQALLKNKKEQKKLEDDLRKNGQLKTSKPSSSNSNKKNSSKNKKQAEKEGREEEKARQKGRDSAKKTLSKKSNSSKKQNQEQKDLAKQLNKGKGVKVKLQPDAKSLTKGLKNLGGKKGTKIKLQPDTKSLTKGLKNLGGKKGTKIKLQADTKGLTKDLKNLGGKKGTKVKLQADTKGLTKSLKNLGGKNGTKVKLQADTKALTKSLSNLGKGKGVKVKLQADTKGLDKSLKSLKGLKKSQNIKINVSGNASSKISKIKSSLNGLSGKSKNISINVRGNAVSQVNKIKSALNGIKGSKNISINASGNAASFASKVKSSLAGIHNKHVTISASGNAASMAQRASSAINSIPASHQTNITAHDGASPKANAAKSAIENIPKKHNTHISVTGDGQAIAKAHSVAAAINSIPSSKTVTINVNKNETHTITTEHKSKSMAITPENSQPVSPMTSMSVVAGNPAMNMAINSGAANMGVDANSATNGDKVSGIATTDRSDSTQKVSEDYWRYMGNELYTGLPLDEKVQNLENAVTQADEDMDKLINLSKQRIDLDNKQIAYQRTMQGAYQQQITDVLNELHKYGFQTNGNQITNLNHAKDITGDNASKVDELLGKYQTAYQNFSEATKKIDELQTDIWQQGKNQQDYNNTKDQKMVEKLQRELELVTTAIDNQKNILEREGNSLEDSDYRMKLKNNSDQIYAKSEAVQQLLAEFNQLSVANFVGTKDADNAKNLADSLSQIRDAIMENLDSIDELKKGIRDIHLNSIIESLSKYTDNLSNSIDRLKNNVTNLQDGLLSGTSYNDLMSSNFDVVNLNQKSAYEKSVADKISLERQLDSALDQFARKNVDRTAQVANDQLQIEAQKYNDMLSMAINYARGARNEVGAIDVKYNVSVESDKIEVPNLTHNQEYVQSSIAYQKEMNELKAEYNRLMGEANTAEQKEAINSEMIYKQLELQEKVYKSMIEADQKAINDLREQAKNPDMTTEQLKTITDQITEYEKNVIDAQNSIKDAVKNRFEYEKSLIDEQIDEYKRASDTISTLVSIADTLHLEGSTQAAIINQQYASTYREYNNYLDLLQRLRNELSGYEKNSYEYNQLKAMIDEYQTSLDSTMSSLMDISKNEFGQTLDSIQKEFEKSVNKGLTADQAKFGQDVWYNPMQKELRLEEMRLKIVELEDKTVEKRIAALDAQERMSKAEADYVDKQLDLALAQQKLDNTINKKDVRYLEKDKDGKFNWTYIADQANVEEAQRAVNSAKQALEESKISNRNDYIQKVSETINSIKDGSINQEEARKRLEQLNDSYKFILKDIPTFDIAKVEDIIKAYNDYEKKNSDIINDYKQSVKPEVTQGYETIVKGFGDQFKAVSKDLGEIFGKQLREALNLPNGIRNAYGNGNDRSLVINGGLTIKLPNVKDADGFTEAMKNLPQLAQQYATKKL